MSERIQAIRGMNDVLPEESFAWQTVEHTFTQCLSQYGYKEIRFPIVECTQLFKRTIGEVTDIVEKEMYSFTDLNGESLTLRPEGTAGCVRACLEHGLLYNQQQKLWYKGPMFRHEKPQKGRYRQFHQLGVETYGYSGFLIELELIAICQRLWRMLGIADDVTLEINTLGSLAERQAYRQQLIDYLQPLAHQLDSDSQRRLSKNPLRILDSKNPQMQSIIQNAPKLVDTISVESKTHFASFCEGLEALGIEYKMNPFLVRGLDYYSDTVFEWVTQKLGSQATVCAGGRYDQLVEQLGGQPTPAIGFALGIERLLLLIETVKGKIEQESPPLLFFIAADDRSQKQALLIAEELRNQHTDWKIIVPMTSGSFKSQFKKADKSGAQFAVIIGQDELDKEEVGLKNLRQNSEQVRLSKQALVTYLESHC